MSGGRITWHRRPPFSWSAEMRATFAQVNGAVERRGTYTVTLVARGTWTWSLVAAGRPSDGGSSIEYEHPGRYRTLTEAKVSASRAARVGFYWASGEGWRVEGTSADFPDGLAEVEALASQDPHARTAAALDVTREEAKAMYRGYPGGMGPSRVKP